MGKWKLKILILLALAFLGTTGFGWAAKRDVNVRQGPGSDTPKLGHLEKGEEVCVLQQEEGFGKIIYEGREAYVSMHYLEMLDHDVPLKLHYTQPVAMNVLGDSVTSGEHLAPGEQAYPEALGALAGAAVYNYGAPATTIAINNENSFLERYVLMNREANLILVLGGTNDFGLATPLGSRENLASGCFYGSLNDLTSGLKAQYPGIPIIFMTPLHREKEEFPNAQGLLLADYVQAIREICEEQGIYVLDLFEEESLNFRDSMPLYMPDGLHPNAEGHRILAEFIYQSLFCEENDDEKPPVSCEK